MDLVTYFSRDDAMDRPALAAAIGVSDAQLRQWVRRYSGRQPGPANAVAIERATGGLVRRWDLRPDWALIWPDLLACADAPPVDQGLMA